jgi:hypothetical protein
MTQKDIIPESVRLIMFIVTLALLQIERIADYTVVNRQVDPTPYPTDYTSQLTNLGTRMTVAETGLQVVTTSANSNRNRIVNGEFNIDQRNQGALFTYPNGYTVDRWVFGQTKMLFNVRRNLNNVTPPPGFTSYLGAICITAQSNPGSDYVVLLQPFERQQLDDFNFGTANAVALSFSFWVYVSTAGLYTGAMRGAINALPSFAFSYTVTAANTWQYFSIAIPGCTTYPAQWTATLPTDRVADIMLTLLLGSSYSVPASQINTWQNANLLGQSSAANVASAVGQYFYVTGVQLERGTVATAFDRRPITVEFALCQRWLIVHGGANGVNRALTAQVSYWTGNSITFSLMAFPQPMRTAPTASSTGAPALVVVRARRRMRHVVWRVLCSRCPSCVYVLVSERWCQQRLDRELYLEFYPEH